MEGKARSPTSSGNEQQTYLATPLTNDRAEIQTQDQALSSSSQPLHHMAICLHDADVFNFKQLFID